VFLFPFFTLFFGIFQKLFSKSIFSFVEFKKVNSVYFFTFFFVVVFLLVVATLVSPTLSLSMEMELTASSSNISTDLDVDGLDGFFSGVISERSLLSADWEPFKFDDELNNFDPSSWPEEESVLLTSSSSTTATTTSSSTTSSSTRFGIEVSLTPEEQATFHDMVSQLYNSNSFVQPLSYIEIKKEGGSKYEEETCSSPSLKIKEEADGTRRKRPRAKKNQEDGPAPLTVTLPREKILALSSKEMQEYIDDIKRNRLLSAEEDKELKRQKRLIKNRESALASRTRKKAHIEDLRYKVGEVQKERDSTSDSLDALTKETEQLKQQAFNMQNIIRKTPFLSGLWDQMMQTKPRQKLDMNISSFRSSTVLLLILLCMFGMFFESLSSSSCEKPLLPRLSSMAEESTGISPSALHHSNARNGKLGYDEPISSISSSSYSEYEHEEYCPETKPSNSSSSYLVCAPAQHVSLDSENSYEETSLPYLITFFLPLQLVQQALVELASSLTIASSVSTSSSSTGSI